MQILHEHRGCELRAQVANHGQWSTETWFAYALLTRSLRGAYANLRHQTCKENMTANIMKFSELQSGPNLNTTNSERSSKRLLSPRSGEAIPIIIKGKIVLIL